VAAQPQSGNPTRSATSMAATTEIGAASSGLRLALATSKACV
jgi:hypothetical protein